MVDNNSMMTINDEIIMAYVDGQLDSEEAAMVARALQDDLDLRARAALFQETTDMVQGIYDAPLDEEVPARLLETVIGRQKAGPFVRLRTWWSKRLRVLFMKPVLVPALVVLVFLGSGLLYHLNVVPRTGTHRYPALARSQELSRGLGSTPSGRSFTLKRFAVRVVPVLTFPDRENRFCREFDVLSAKKDGLPIGQGIACLDSSGTWKTIAYTVVAASNAEQKTDQRYELAGKGSQMDKMVDERRIGPVLSLSRERELIRKGWR